MARLGIETFRKIAVFGIFFLISAGIAVGLILSTELALRIIKKGPPPSRAGGTVYDSRSLYLDIHKKFFTKSWKPNSTVEYRSNRPNASPQEFSADKKKNVKRVFVVGGSVAVKYMESDNRLEEMLARVFEYYDFEFIGCGMHAYDSYRASLVFSEVLNYSPDLIIVMSGNNEEFYRKSVVSPWRIRIRMLCDNLWLCRDTLNLFGGIGKQNWLSFEERQEQFRRNLVSMLGGAMSRNVPVAVCTLPYNIADCSPRGGTSVDPLFLEARTFFENGRYNEAAKKFAGYLNSDPGDLTARFWLGKSFERLFNYSRALENYLFVVENDARIPNSGIRCPPSRNEIIRRSAASQNAILVDLEKRFQEQAPHGLVGGGFFHDGVHWRQRYNPAVSFEVARVLCLNKGKLGWNNSKAQDCASIFSKNVQRRIWNPFCDEEQREKSADSALQWVAESVSNAGSDKNTMLNEWWIYILKSSFIESPVPLQALAGGKTCFGHYFPYLYAGETFMLLKDYSRAVSCFNKAFEINPQDPKICVSRARAHLAKGDMKAFWKDLKMARETAQSCDYKMRMFIANSIEVLKGFAQRRKKF